MQFGKQIPYRKSTISINAPFHQGDLPYFHWHIEIFSRIARVVGFEWGSGFYIDTVLPEEAAGILRDAE